MNTTKLTLLSILESFAKGCKEKPNTENADSHQLFALAKQHSVVGIVAYTMDKFDLFENDEVRQKFMHEYDRTVMNMLSREVNAMRLCAELNSLGIDHILFKGMMVSAAYPIPSLRTYGDIDMVIREKDTDKLCEFMKTKGFIHSLTDAGVVNAFHKTKEHYECHKNLNVSNLKDKSYFENLWDNAVSEDNHTYRFEHNFHLCYLITHLEKHVYGSGAGLRMYLDIVLYAQKYKESLDWEKVRETLTSLGLGEYLNTLLYVCSKWFGMSIPSWVKPMDENVYAQMCDFTFAGGVFGDQSAEKNAEDALRHSMADGKKNARFRFLLQRVFPPFSELVRLYPKYTGKPYLAPVAWINHVVRFFSDKKFSRVKVISSANTDVAKQKKEFLESIGSVH